MAIAASTMNARARSSDPPTVSPSFRPSMRAPGASGGVGRGHRRSFRLALGMDVQPHAAVLEPGELAIHPREHALVLAASDRHGESSARSGLERVVADRLGEI